jgi:aarF domain-containing kinase
LVTSQDDGSPAIVFLDAGIVTELKAADFQNFSDVFRAICKRDGRQAGELILERSPHSRCVEPEQFVQGIEDIVHEALSTGLSLENVKVGELLGRVLSLACTYSVQLDSNFTKVALSIMVLEGVGRSLDPKQDLLLAATPYVVRQALWGPSFGK